MHNVRGAEFCAFTDSPLLVLLAILASRATSATGIVSSVDYANVIYVDCDNGLNKQGCGSRQEPCRNFSQAANALKNDTLISIPGSSLCPLHEVVHISGYANIGIAGNVNLTLECSNGQSVGLYFAEVDGLQLTNITLSGCGALFDSASRNTSSSVPITDKFRVAMYVMNVTNFVIHSMRFHSSTGMGLAVYNTNGNVSVIKCDFINNSVSQDERSIYPGGGGMLLHYSYCTPGLTSCDPSTNTHNSNCNILIEGCQFVGNQATIRSTLIVFHRQKGSGAHTFGLGGGLAIMFSGNSTCNTLSLQNLVFQNNSAVQGGAVSVEFIDNASSNFFIIASTRMENNKAGDDGGALFIRLEFYNCAPCVSNNYVNVSDTYFKSNSAKWGGALKFFSSWGRENSCSTNILFCNCTWDSNHAKVAAAVDIAPNVFDDLHTGFLPVPVFEKCTFVKNNLLSAQSGILNIQDCEVHFRSYAHFEDNNGTAVYSSDGIVAVLNDTVANFMNNIGSTGGGLALMGSSVLRTYPGAYLNFTKNTALELGGAIYYYSTNPALFLYSYTCFIQYVDITVEPGNWTNVTLYFGDNVASGYGQAIYATTLLPCAREYGGKGSIDEKLRYLFIEYPFVYKDYYKKDLISTSPHRLDIREGTEYTLAVAPGQVFHTGICAYDELNQTVNAVFHTVITNGSKYSNISSVYSYTSDGTVKLTGLSGHAVQLTMQTAGPIKKERVVDVFLASCPPGYYPEINNSTKSLSECVCSANINDHRYDGILRCDADNFTAILNEGYWAGCLPESNVFVTGQCPLGFCKHVSEDLALSHTCNGVDKLLCGPRNRRGTLCGECVEEHTVYYHSARYKCGECKYPKLGLLFYALTELLPLTLLFITIIIFGISFTSGPANSFIFFAQVLNFFDITSLESLQFPNTVIYLTNIYQFIFGAFNFDFFKLDVFSFCLWEGAKVLDIFVFKYATTAYAMILLLIFVLAVKFIPRCYFCLQRCVFRHAITSSIVQGISALLIISYAQCAKVSFQILTAVFLRRDGLHHEKTVVFLSGETEYFSRDHLPYAIPAVFVLLLTTIPPGVLIIHPTLTRLCGKRSCTAFQRDEEHDRVHCFSRWSSRLMPLFDSFQGCFKDSCRYFAGLYFIYRFAISMAFALSDNGMELYFCLEVILIVILAFHAIIQPYQNPFYNMVDAAIFADLAIINGISIYDFYWAQFTDVSSKTVAVASSIQVTLIYLPLLYMSVMVVLKIAVRFASVRKIHWIRRLNHYVPLISEQSLNYERLGLSNSSSENQLPPRLLEESTHNRRQLQTTYGATTRATM